MTEVYFTNGVPTAAVLTGAERIPLDTPLGPAWTLASALAAVVVGEVWAPLTDGNVPPVLLYDDQGQIIMTKVA